ncbi:hypothetical protein Gura_1988 [Geotalea uraniireducens Rf4]|uniref:NHL repeat containing protein n=1 Tax=Geotalea uraniireducens (strain Rf4) TaxID=351605 RepID=A5GFH3_GEOUR|nr:hypothetical protein Gura_1988 [Geotalea uraniireducens Rf4]
MRTMGELVNRIKYGHLLLSTVLVLIVLSTPVLGGEIKADYLYKLSDFTGVVPYSWVRPVVDRKTHEIYVANFSERSIRVFNENGMLVYEFGDDINIGNLYDLAIADDGNILLLSYKGTAYALTKCNFRGEPISTLEVRNLPPSFSKDFTPTVIFYHGGHIYLADKEAMKVVVADANGDFIDGYDLAAILEFDDKKKQDSGLVGFSVDREGNLLFTVPVIFQAYIVSPDRKVRSFGARGSSPGKFNIVGGIVADDKGTIYVTDTLRCVVMIFDKDFNFKTEFGYRGGAKDNLISPMELAIDGDRLYVTQSRNRGVSVFRITAN